MDERFIVHKVVGKGSFGAVYSGVDLKTQLPVAIKMAHSKQDNILIKEAKILTKLRNINGFPKLISSFVLDNQSCIV